MLRGGNGIEALWEGREVNLHHVWDSSLAEKIAGGRRVRDAVRWGNELYEQLEQGRWRTEEWGCEEMGNGTECPLRWAVESNKLMCGVVLGEDWVEGGMEGMELSGEYFDGVKGVVEERVVMAGWRMARWLEAMFEGREEEEGRVEELEDVETSGWVGVEDEL